MPIAPVRRFFAWLLGPLPAHEETAGSFGLTLWVASVAALAMQLRVPEKRDRSQRHKAHRERKQGQPGVDAHQARNR